MAIAQWSWRDRAALVAALLGPLVVCLALIPARSQVPNTDAALVLVAAVVALAAFGNRVAGLVSSVSGALWFDVFLTAPYQSLSIFSRHDIETFLLILLVGAAVTEFAVRGRRSRIRAATDERYLDAIQSTSALAGTGRSELIGHACAQLSTLLGLRTCRFESNQFGGLPRLDADGEIRSAGRVWDTTQHGLPDHDVELLASSRHQVQGRFVLTPTAGTDPTPAALRCAVVVAELTAAALADSPARA